jgi:hypothetical protein
MHVLGMCRLRAEHHLRLVDPVTLHTRLLLAVMVLGTVYCAKVKTPNDTMTCSGTTDVQMGPVVLATPRSMVSLVTVTKVYPESAEPGQQAGPAVAKVCTQKLSSILQELPFLAQRYTTREPLGTANERKVAKHVAVIVGVATWGVSVGNADITRIAKPC